MNLHSIKSILALSCNSKAASLPRDLDDGRSMLEDRSDASSSRKLEDEGPELLFPLARRANRLRSYLLIASKLFPRSFCGPAIFLGARSANLRMMAKGSCEKNSNLHVPEFCAEKDDNCLEWERTTCCICGLCMRPSTD